MTDVAVLAVLGALFTGAGVEPAPPVSLRGSPAAMEQQNRVARAHELRFYRTEAEIVEAVSRGELVDLPGNEDYQVADFVSLPFAQPAARTWVERTAALYREACGEPLVVTSAVRAIANQPPNAHALSVHPAGMAIDLRVSQEPACREWLEAKLTSLEDQGLINGIRERRPPHYHVAVFPEPYLAYAAAQRGAEVAEEAAPPEDAAVGQGAGVAWAVVLVLAALVAAFVAWQVYAARRR
jgi:hypothetical protein